MAGLVDVWRRWWPVKQEETPASSGGDDEVILTRVISPWERHLIEIQSVLIWENPTKSAVAVVTVNVIFWLLVWCDVKPIFLVSVSLLTAYTYHQWVHVIWPEIRIPQPERPLDESEEWTAVHPNMLSAPELGRYLTQLYHWSSSLLTWLLRLRQEKPAVFCALMCSMLSVTALIGCLVRGCVILYCLIMTMMCGPGCAIHLLPDTFYEYVGRLRAILRGEVNVLGLPRPEIETELDEFLPEERTVAAQAALAIPLRHTMKETEDTESREMTQDVEVEGMEVEPVCQFNLDETSNSDFLSGLPVNFPSFDYNSLDSTLLQFIPTLPEHQAHEETQPGGSNRGSNGLEFVASHFGDSSEDEDNSFTHGLNFQQSRLIPVSGECQRNTTENVSSETLAQMVTNAMTRNLLTTIGQNLVASVMGSQAGASSDSSSSLTNSRMQLPHLSDSQEEDEFELIAEEEFQ